MAKEQPDDGKVPVTLIVTKDGLGAIGDKLRVSPERAQRWCAEGLCSLSAAVIEETKQDDPPKENGKKKKSEK